MRRHLSFYFSRRWTIIFVCYFLILVIGAIDYLTGFEIDVSIFYLIPICFVTWKLGRRPGLVFAFSGALVWYGAAYIFAHEYSLSKFTPYWNTFIKIAFFSVVVIILAWLKDVINLERRREAELKQSNEALEQFANIVSHDLQSPIGHILTLIDLMKQTSFQETDKNLEYLNRIHNSGLRMRKLVKDILSLARVKSSPAEVHEVDLNQVLSDVISDLDNDIRTTQAGIFADKLPSIQAIPEHMYQLFLNLISNAIKFRQSGIPPRIELRAKHGSNFIEIAVMDNGIGFNPKHASRLFKPFERLNPLGTIKGSGLGLAICDQVVRRYNGFIEAKSTPGAGSIFKIHLPLIKKVISAPTSELSER